MYAETCRLALWTGKTQCGRVILMSQVRRTAQSASNIMLLSYYIGMCVFHERQRDICRRRTYSQGFAIAVQSCTCPTTGKILILHKPLHISNTLIFHMHAQNLNIVCSQMNSSNYSRKPGSQSRESGFESLLLPF